MELERCEMTAERLAQGVKVAENGDVEFVAVAVDRNKTPNRRGFVFDWDSPQDVKIDAWLANPVLLYQHNDSLIPIGWVREVDVQRSRVKARCMIPDLSGDADMAEYDRQVVAPVRGAVRNGLLRAVSIGFYIRKDEPADGTVRRIKAFEIVELSVCSIGAHETALIQQTVPDAVVQRFSGHCESSASQDEDHVMYRLSAPEGSALAQADTVGGTTPPSVPPTAPSDKETQAGDWSAIPYARHGEVKKAAEGAEWDAGAEVKAADVDQLKVMCVLEDKENLDAKSGYKLPHHHADGNAVVWRGVAASMGVLLGARGGVKGAGADALKGAYAHVVKHYAQFDKDAPPFRQDYTPLELAALHDAGVIVVPGRSVEPDAAVASPAVPSEPEAGPAAQRPVMPELMGAEVEVICRAVEPLIEACVVQAMSEAGDLSAFVRSEIDASLRVLLAERHDGRRKQN